MLDAGAGTKDVGLTGLVPPTAAAVPAQGAAVDVTVRVHRYEDVAAGEEAVRDE